MSVGARVAIALVGLISAFGFGYVAWSPDFGAAHPWGLYGCAGFCLLIVIACIGGKVGHYALRLICASVFLLYGAYVVDEIAKPDRVIDSGRRSQPSVINAIAGFCVFGVPAGAYTLFGGRTRGDEDTGDEGLDDEEQPC